MRMIQSTRFGEVEVSEKMILQFPYGIPGFLEQKTYALLPYQPDSPFSFLQSLDDPDLTFMVVEPFAFVPDYDFEVDDVIAKELEISEGKPPQIFNIVKALGKLEDMTVNLSAPIVVSWHKQMAIQYLIENTTYSIRHPLFTNGLSAQPKGGK